MRISSKVFPYTFHTITPTRARERSSAELHSTVMLLLRSLVVGVGGWLVMFSPRARCYKRKLGFGIRADGWVDGIKEARRDALFMSFLLFFFPP